MKLMSWAFHSAEKEWKTGKVKQLANLQNRKGLEKTNENIKSRKKVKFVCVYVLSHINLQIMRSKNRKKKTRSNPRHFHLFHD